MLDTVDTGTMEVALWPKYLPTNWKSDNGNTVNIKCLEGGVTAGVLRDLLKSGNVFSGNMLYRNGLFLANLLHNAASNAVNMN